MLIGDYELTELRDTAGITTLFVIFTMIGVVILLNVLIAVVSDSYEKATMSSALIFGGARVIFVAQNEALESLLTPGGNPLQVLNGRHTAFAPAIFRISRWLVLVAIIVTAFSKYLNLQRFGTNHLLLLILIVYFRPTIRRFHLLRHANYR
jgi:hypothetical protein